MTELPQPLTSADCELRDFAFMPLDVVRLRDSDLAIQVTGEEFRCAVLLWCAAWHQIPAASLPDDDKTLASLAGFGRAVGEWEKHKAGALRGWIKCSDGRLYHPVVAEKANESWAAKHAHAHRKLLERLRKKGVTREECPGFDEWFSAGMPKEWPALSGGKDKSSGGKEDSSDGSEKDSDGNDGISEEGSSGNPAENTLKGQGQGQGQGEEKNISPQTPPADSDQPDPGEQPESDDSARATAYGALSKALRVEGVDVHPGLLPFRQWVDSGLTLDEAMAAVTIARGTKPKPEHLPWAYIARVLDTQRRAAQAVPVAKHSRDTDQWGIPL